MDFLKHLDKFFETLGLSKASLFVRGLALIVSGSFGLITIVKLFDLEAHSLPLIGGGLAVIFVLVTILLIQVDRQEKALAKQEKELAEQERQKKLEERRLAEAIRQKQLRDLHPHFSEADVDHAQKYYIETRGQNVPPSRDQEPGLSSAFIVDKPLIPLFLDKNLKNTGEDDRFYLVLADSGMGKTTFMLNLYLEYVRNRAQHDYEMKLFAFRYPSAYEDVKQLVEDKKDLNTILLLDAFDEDGEASKNYKVRLDQWMDLVKNFREVIITSRTQFFPNEAATKGLLQIPKNNLLSPGFHQFKVMYISPFSDEDIIKYVEMRFPSGTPKDQQDKERAIQIVDKSPKLMVRPMLLANIDAFLNDPKKVYSTTYEIYDVLIEKWLWREAGRRGKQAQQFYDELKRFSKRLAIEIYNKWETEERLHITEEELISFAQLNNFDPDILSKLEMRSKSLLNRDAIGNLKFSHKSVLEFFLAVHAENHPSFWQRLKLKEFDVIVTFLQERGILPEMTMVEGGTFQMAEGYSVTLSDYEIGTYSVTQILWQNIMGDNPSRFTGDLMRPVECVSWEDCQEFIQKLNEKTGLNFRLPTEAEWEFAARGGNLSKGFEYAGSNNLDEVGWYGGNSGSKTHSVGQKAPNELGLYDMSGNVWEWCQDWYDKYPSGRHTNLQGAESGVYRVLRGGSWHSLPRHCRVADRDYGTPLYRSRRNGFRLSRHIEQSP